MRKNIKLIIKAAVTIALMAIVMRRADLRLMADLVYRCDLFLLVAGILALLASHLILVANWKFVLKSKAYQTPYFALLKLHFIGLFYNQILPTSIGGDIVKGFYLADAIKNRVEAFSSLLVVRILGFVSVLILLICGFLLQPSFFSGFNLSQGLGMSAILIAIIFLAFYYFFKSSAIARLIKRFHFFSNIAHKIEAFISALKAYYRKPNYVFAGLLLSFCTHSLVIMENFLIAKSLNIQVGLKFFIFAVPAIVVITLLPISISGLGIREGSFAFLFSLVGVGSSEAVAFSLVGYFILLSLGLLSGLIYVLAPRLGVKKILEESA